MPLRTPIQSRIQNTPVGEFTSPKARLLPKSVQLELRATLKEQTDYRPEWVRNQAEKEDGGWESLCDGDGEMEDGSRFATKIGDRAECRRGCFWQ